VYGSYWSTHRVGWAFLVGPVLGPQDEYARSQDSPRFRDERIWGRVVWERTNVRVDLGAGVVGRGTEERRPRMETVRARERRSWSRWIRWRREGRRGGSSPTYPKFQSVPPVSPRYRFLFRRADPPHAGPPRRWRGGSAVSCGRPASLLLRRERARLFHGARIVYGSLPSPAPPALSYAKSTSYSLPSLSLGLFFLSLLLLSPSSLTLSLSFLQHERLLSKIYSFSYMCESKDLDSFKIFRSSIEQFVILLESYTTHFFFEIFKNYWL